MNTNQEVKKFNKPEQVKKVAEMTGKSQKDVELIYDAICTMVEENLLEAGKIKLGSLATFEVREVAAKAERQGRHPKTGETIIIEAKPATRTVGAKPTSNLKNSVK